MVESLTGSQVKLAAAPVAVAVVESIGPCPPSIPQLVSEKRVNPKAIEQVLLIMDFRMAKLLDSFILCSFQILRG